MNVNYTAKVDGFYEVGVRRNAASGNADIEWTGEHENLLLNGFFTHWKARLLGGSSWRFFVGTGADAAAATQSQLISQVGVASDTATVTSNNNELEGSDYISSSTGIAQWPIGAIVANISEIGCNLRNLTTGVDLDSRALIVDNLGATRTITVTADDQLVVRYTLRYRIPIDQHVSVVDFGGVSTTCTLESLYVTSSTIWGITALLNGFNTNNTIKTSATLGLFNDVTGSHTAGLNSNVAVLSVSETASGRRVTVSANASQLNIEGTSGIKYLVIANNSSASFHRQGILFDPPIAKDDTKTLTLNFDYTLARA